ncbi:MAG TPA: hypothetical protein VGB30_02725 [bacterium]|jgi:hypothetical protein
MRVSVILFLLIAPAGCASGNSISPTINQAPEIQTGNSVITDGPYMLWGEWTFYFNESHNQVDAVPRRAGRFHLNALKFLEEYCTDCLNITEIKNNGDSTIDLTVQIRHPFPGHPEYTGFDVKGIIMFEGSETFHSNEFEPLYPDDYIVSWKGLGDPEILNADGYTYRWNPSYYSHSELPIFNYIEGKFTNGTPTANVNAYKEFYSLEERHIFKDDAVVSKTYKIWIPEGEPVIAGYAIEASWVPPVVIPVQNVLTDFPVTANQPDLMHFDVVINDGALITFDDECCLEKSVYQARAEIEYWYLSDEYIGNIIVSLRGDKGWSGTSQNVSACDGPDSWKCLAPNPYDELPNGIHRFLAFEYHYHVFDPAYKAVDPAIDIYEVIVDIQ